ncbi:hypothetical protein GGR58DRAFT_496256 [Xylaria digitata]|nr:hypothetical protein GGR58DRAFT_496256 [Xylaria digitata]
MFPTFGSDGDKICWTESNFPDMTWSSNNKLFTADFTDDGTVQDMPLVAGPDSVSVTKPRVPALVVLAKRACEYPEKLRTSAAVYRPKFARVSILSLLTYNSILRPPTTQNTMDRMGRSRI